MSSYTIPNVVEKRPAGERAPERASELRFARLTGRTAERVKNVCEVDGRTPMALS